MKNYYELVDANKAKSNLVIILFVTFISASAYFIARGFGYGLDFVGMALIISGITSLGSYYYSDKIVLSLSNARPVTKKDYFNFYTVTENLCSVARIPIPKLYVIEDTAMNAFATGRDPQHAALVATTGLLDKLTRTELEGVIGHELSHIQNYDIRLMSLVTILVGVLTLMADWLLRWGMGRRRNNDDRESSQIQMIMFVAGLLLAILSPIIAQLIQLAISRRREFLADASSARLTKFPEGLASALEKLKKDKEPLEAANKATAHLYIVSPLNNRKDSIGWFANLFNTHPPIQERIKALRS